MLSIHWRSMHALPTLIGIIVGVSVSLCLAYGGFNFVQAGKIYGFHPGLIGLIFNMLIAIIGSNYLNKKQVIF